MINGLGSVNIGMFGLSNQDPRKMQNLKEKRPFQMTDLNGDDMLDKTEVMSFVDSLSLKTGKSINGEELFKKIDTNQDGLIDRDEFKAGRKNVKDIVDPPPRKVIGQKNGEFSKMLMDMLDKTTDEDTEENNGVFDSNTMNNTLLNRYMTSAGLLSSSNNPLNIIA